MVNEPSVFEPLKVYCINPAPIFEVSGFLHGTDDYYTNNLFLNFTQQDNDDNILIAHVSDCHEVT